MKLDGIPSLGKTTLVLNIANNVAGSGRDVLFFSLDKIRIKLILKITPWKTFMPASAEQS
jgi:replicative DNA helicase